MISLFVSLMLLASKNAIAALSLIQPSIDSAQINSTLLPAGTLSPPKNPNPAPEEPFTMTNVFVHPPIAVIFQGYGDAISRATANVCLHRALDHALSTRDHTPLTPIAASDLDYTNANVSLNFHPIGLVIWEEWKNALYLMLEFVGGYDTREYLFVLEVFGWGGKWDVVGQGSLITF